SPGPYLEMFARYPRPGWTVWGNEADEGVQPKGRAHRGYNGGSIESFPSLEPNERMSEWLATRVAKVLAEEYDSGSSVQQLVDATGYSISRVRALLTKGGVEFRRRGRPRAVKAGATS